MPGRNLRRKNLKEHLAVFHRMSIFDKDIHNHAVRGSLDLRNDLHGFDHSDDLALRNARVQADKQEGRREEKSDGLTAAERDELVRLRRENKQLRLERDILSRATAWFARETGTIPSGSSSL